MFRAMNFLKKTINYFHSYFVDKWKYIYLEKSIDAKEIMLPKKDESLIIRIAQRNDISRIRADIYPYLTSSEGNDWRYLERIGDHDFTCFVAEKDKKIIHYFLVFDDALYSPLVKTPFYKNNIISGDAYLGTAFTVPDARGTWVVPYSLQFIFDYFKSKKIVSRALVIVHKDTPGAQEFYKFLGFNVVENASPAGLVDSFIKQKK
jgi:ribosomal protein S18 acetylase RimI-like enzyme